MTYKRPESVLVVVHNPQGQVLVLQRDDDPEFWQSVTGTMEMGECPFDTAQREVCEEIGVDISVAPYQLIDCRQVNQYEIRPQWRYRYPPECAYNTEYVFRVGILGTEPIHLTEHLQYGWLNKSDAIDRVWSQTNKLAIERFVP